MTLPAPLENCLRQIGSGLTMQMRFLGDGERRGRPMFGRLSSDWHSVATVVSLAKAGLVTGNNDECDIIVLTDQGKAWLKAHPPPAA